MAVISNLRVVIGGDVSGFRNAVQQTAKLVQQAEKDIGQLGSAFATLENKGKGFRAPAGGADGGQFISASRAADIYAGKVDSLFHHLDDLRFSIVSANQALFGQAAGFLAADAMKAASAATSQYVPIVAEAIGTSVSFGAAVQRMSATAIIAIPRVTALQQSLRYLNLVNYQVTKGMKEWNALGVLAGPGRLVEAFDAVRQVFTGLLPPTRLLAFAVQQYAIPALVAFGAQLANSGTNAAAVTLGENLIRLARDVQNVGTAFQQGLIMRSVGIFQQFGSVASGASNTFASLAARVGGFAFSVGRINVDPLLNLLGKAAIGFGRLMVSSDGGRVSINALAQSLASLTGRLIAAGQQPITMQNVWNALGATWRGATTTILTLGSAAVGATASMTAGFVRLGMAAGRLGLQKVAAGATALAGSAARSVGGLFAMGGAAGKAARESEKLAKATAKAQAGIGGMRAVAMSMAPTLAAFGLGAAGLMAAFKGGMHGAKLAADFEQLDVAFTTMLGDGTKAQKLLTDLTAFSAATPFQFTELQGAAKSLLAFGTPLNDIIPTMRQLGDISAGTGKDIGELALAYGKVRVKGVASMEEINRFTEAGVPLIDSLSKSLGVTDEQLFKLIEDKAIGFQQIEAAIHNMTAKGSQFGGMMGRQSQTVTGLISTLRDNVNLALRDVMGALMNAFNVKGAVAGLIGLTGWFRSTFVPIITGAVQAVASFVSPVFSGIASFVSENWNTIATTGQAAWMAISEIVASVSMFVQENAIAAFGAVTAFLQQAFGVDLLSTFSNFRDTVLGVFFAAEFGARNWRDMLNIAVLELALGFVKIGSIITHVLTVAVPGYLTWFANNWQDVFTDIATFTTSIFTNLWKNISNFFTSLWEFIRSRGASGFEMAWTPLTDGFVSAIKELPEIAAREIGPLEKELSDSLGILQKQAGEDFQAFAAKRFEEVESQRKAAQTPAPAGSNLPDPKQVPGIGAGAGQGKEKQPETLKAVEKGSKEAFEAVAKARKEADQRKLVANSTTQVQLLGQINGKLGQKPGVQLALGAIP